MRVEKARAGHRGPARKSSEWTRDEPYELVCIRLPKTVVARMRKLGMSMRLGDDEVVERLLLEATQKRRSANDAPSPMMIAPEIKMRA